MNKHIEGFRKHDNEYENNLLLPLIFDGEEVFHFHK